MNYAIARQHMIDSQIRTAGVVDPILLEAFSTTPRELFVPEGMAEIAYADDDLKIADGCFLMEPLVHAQLIEAANIKPSDVVLDIAVGTGYSSAILSAKATTIIALEDNPKLRAKANATLQGLDICNVIMIEDAIAPQGCAEHATYNVIVINGAVSHVPDMILAQLSKGGRLVTIVKANEQGMGKATLFHKCENGHVSSRTLFDAATPFVKGFAPVPSFAF